MGGPTFGTRGKAAPLGALSHCHFRRLSKATVYIQEISDGLRLKLPPPNKESRSATDRPRTLKNEIKNVVGFLVRMDELVWRRSEYGANREVFDPENISAVEERVRLWERVARDYCSE